CGVSGSGFQSLRAVWWTLRSCRWEGRAPAQITLPFQLLRSSILPLKSLIHAFRHAPAVADVIAIRGAGQSRKRQIRARRYPGCAECPIERRLLRIGEVAPFLAVPQHYA